MSSFLKDIEKHYDLFNITDGEIIEFFSFKPDVYEALTSELRRANKGYKEKCEYLGKKPSDFEKISVKKDAKGKCYLEVVGADNYTRLIINQDDCDHNDYRSVLGFKIPESQFEREIDYHQTKKAQAANIASRFLREEPLPVDLSEEMDSKKLIDYYYYINSYLSTSNIIEIYDEPENSVGKSTKKFEAASARINPVVDYMYRKQELMKHRPKEIKTFRGKNTGREYDTFIYERDGNVLAIAEPVSGVEYQYDLNLGPIDPNDIENIKATVRAALEAPEHIAMCDDAKMRKNHTTMSVFSENIEIFLNNAESTKPFKSQVEKAKAVYR